MNTPDDQVRETVSKAYSEALKRSTESCCAPACCAPPTDIPAPAVAVRTAGYGDELTTHATAAASSFGCGNPLAFADVQEGATVVDLGSGAGFDLLIAAEKVGPEGRVIGVDMTDDMIAAARRNTLNAGATQVEVRKGIIEELPVRDGEADWVISNCVVNLSPEKHRVFAEIARVLKPSGRIRISDIVVEELPQWVREHPAAYAACVAGAIPEAEYLQGLRAAGLVDVEVAERFVYDADQILGMINNDIANPGIDDDTLAAGVQQVEGKIWSASIVGRLPA